MRARQLAHIFLAHIARRYRRCRFLSRTRITLVVAEEALCALRRSCALYSNLLHAASALQLKSPPHLLHVAACTLCVSGIAAISRWWKVDAISLCTRTAVRRCCAWP